MIRWGTDLSQLGPKSRLLESGKYGFEERGPKCPFLKPLEETDLQQEGPKIRLLEPKLRIWKKGTEEPFL